MGELPNGAGEAAADAASASMTTSIEAAASWSAAIIESCSEAIISTSSDGQVVSWNSAAAQLSGYTADEAIGRSWQFMVPVDEVGELVRAMLSFRDGQKAFRIETHLRRKDGVLIDTLLSISTIRDRDGAHNGFSAMLRDITEDKLAEGKLRQSEEKFKTVFKYSSDGISIAALIDGKYLEVNDEFCRMLNLSPEEIIGRTAVELGILTDAQQDEFARGLLQAGAVRNREMTVTARDGIARRSLISANIVELDGIQCTLGFIKDVSDLRRAEDDLLRTERQLSDVLDNAPLAVIAINSDRVITAASGRALAGMRSRSMNSRVSASAKCSYLRTLFCGTSIAHLEAKLSARLKTSATDKGASKVWYSPVWDHERRVTGAIAVATDITAAQAGRGRTASQRRVLSFAGRKFGRLHGGLQSGRRHHLRRRRGPERFGL